MKCCEFWQIIGRGLFSCHESIIKADEMQIKHQECTRSVVVVLFINYSHSGRALVAARVYRAQQKCKECSRSLAGSCFHGPGATLLALLPGIYYVHEFCVALILHFYCSA